MALVSWPQTRTTQRYLPFSLDSKLLLAGRDINGQSFLIAEYETGGFAFEGIEGHGLEVKLWSDGKNRVEVIYIGNNLLCYIVSFTLLLPIDKEEKRKID